MSANEKLKQRLRERIAAEGKSKPQASGKSELFEEPKTTFTEDLINTLAVDGSVARDGFIQFVNSVKGDKDFDGDQMMDNVLKKKFTSARDFLKFVSDETGLEESTISAGIGAGFGTLVGGPVGGLKGAIIGGAIGAGIGFTDFGGDLVTDIATSPSTYLLGPAGAALKSSSTIKKGLQTVSKIDNALLNYGKQSLTKKALAGTGRLALKTLPKTQEGAARFATGAMLGALSIKEDDDPADVAMRMLLLGKAGEKGGEAISKIAKTVNNAATEALDNKLIGEHFDYFNDLKENLIQRLGPDQGDEAFQLFKPSEAEKQFRNTKLSPQFRGLVGVYNQGEEAIRSAATKAYMIQGEKLGKSGKELRDYVIDKVMGEFRQTRADVFSHQSRVRNKIYDRMVRELKGEQGQDVSKRTLDEALRQATAQSNNIMDKKLNRLLRRNPEFKQVADTIRQVNRERVKTHNAFWKRNKSGLFPNELDHAQDITGFTPINYWAFDADIGNDIADSFRDVSVSAMRRATDKVEAFSEKFTAQELDNMASNAYAGMFLSRSEKTAQDIVTKLIVGRKNEKPITDRMLDLWNKMDDEQITHSEAMNEMGKLFIDGYDKLLTGVKGGILVSGLAWLKGNLMDNTVRSYMLGNNVIDSSRLAAQSLAEPVLGIPIQMAKAVDRKLNLNILKDFEGNAFNKIMDSLTPRAGENAEDVLTRIEWSDPKMKLASDYGVLDTNKTIDFRAGARSENTEMFGMLASNPKKEKELRKLAALISSKSKKKGTLDEINKRIWDSTMAKVSNASETSQRYVVFNNLVNSTAKIKYPDLYDKYFKKGAKGSIDEVLKKSRTVDNRQLLEPLFPEDAVRTVQENIATLDAIQSGKMFKSLEDSALISREQAIKDMINHSTKIIDDAKKTMKEGHSLYDSVIGNAPKYTDKSIKNAQEASKIKQLYGEVGARVNDMFFDYGNVTMFEREIMKRFFPFWTFWTRNFMKWNDMMFDSEQIGKVMQVSKLISSQGRPVSEEERREIPDFYRRMGARVDQKNPDEIFTMPAMSLIEFANNVSGGLTDAGARLSPIIKTVAEPAFNVDMFRRSKLIPTKGFEAVPIYDNSATLILDSLGVSNELGIYRDQNTGRMFTDNPYTALFLNAQKNIGQISVLSKGKLPVDRWLDEISRMKRDVQFRDREFMDAIQDVALPKKKTVLDKGKKAVKKRQSIGKQRALLKAKRRAQPKDKK